jgi:putative copper resistance protein D
VSLLVDLFGYLEIVLHGLVILSQSMALGGVLFLLLLARPLARELPGGHGIARDTARIAGWAALALVVCEGLTIALQTAVLVDTVELSVPQVLGADFAIAGLVKCAAALSLAACLLGWRKVPAAPLLGLGVVELAAAALSTHAAARMEHSLPLLGVEALHQLGAAIWIGGLPCFMLALARVNDRRAWQRVAARFSRMSMAGVGCILLSGAVMSVAYVGSWAAVYGTVYGVMVAAKVAMFGALLLLGLGNFVTTERLRSRPGASVLRMKRFAEVELGIGISIFFAAASLTSVPPSVDVTHDRVGWAAVVERNTPVWPRLRSPAYDQLAIPELQARLDAAAAATAEAPPPASIPGSGVVLPSNDADIAWSEYNHHWAGLFVLLAGGLALLSQAGVRWARHWPLAMLGLGGFLLIRANPEVWPVGPVGVWESLRDVGVLQHRAFVLLIVVFALFEWSVRTGRLRSGRAALVFPLLTAAGGALLLTHSHAGSNGQDQLLIELTHIPLALAGIGAGWARWLELRLTGRGARIAGWVWPVCFMLCGAMLLNYREA